MRTIIIDNYDSFTFNLVHYCEQFAEVMVMRNDEIDWQSFQKGDKIVLSPGPGLPNESGDLMKVVDSYIDNYPILGVCLGHQAICEYFGGSLYNLKEVLHGVTTKCEVTQEDVLFDSIPKDFDVGHYHSWAVSEEAPGDGMEIIARNEEGIVMASRHAVLPVRGVQFHPESIMTPHGLQIIKNFVELVE